MDESAIFLHEFKLSCDEMQYSFKNIELLMLYWYKFKSIKTLNQKNYI